MSTKEQHPILQALQDYFDNTPPEQLEKDLQELEQFNQYGPDIEGCWQFRVYEPISLTRVFKL